MNFPDLPDLQLEVNLTGDKYVDNTDQDLTNMGKYISYETLYKQNPEDKCITMTCPIEDLTYVIQTFLRIKLESSDTFSLTINDVCLFNTIAGDQDNINAKNNVMETLYSLLRAPDVKKIEIYINNMNINPELLSYLSINSNYVNPAKYVFEATDYTIPFYDQSEYNISAFI